VSEFVEFLVYAALAVISVGIVVKVAWFWYLA
jgi:hypothetical protein